MRPHSLTSKLILPCPPPPPRAPGFDQPIISHSPDSPITQSTSHFHISYSNTLLKEENVLFVNLR